MKLRTSSQPISTFAVLSLTDIVFLLLIFFLLTSTFIMQAGISVDLPKMTVPEQAADRTLIVSIDSGGSVYLDADPVSEAELRAGIQQRLMTREQIVVIRAAKNLTLSTVVGVMDVVKSAGASRFLIATEVERE